MEKDNENSNSNSVPIFHFMTHKAGMDTIDAQKISQQVLDISKNSEFYKRQQEKKQKYDEKISEMLKTIEHLNKDPCQLYLIDKQIEANIDLFEKQRYLKKFWAHFDLDMFFVACEIRDNPSLEGKPVAVGGLSMISTANYIARKFGVRSAMPGFIAKKLCPELILIPGNYKKYEETSKIFKDILKIYDPELEGMGLDEANLDLTNYLNENNIHEYPQIEELCQKIRLEIKEKTKITASCGIAPNKLLAKMGSEINKPNGQFLLKNQREEILDFIAKRPVRKIPGIGSVSEQLLIGLGIHICEDILRKKREVKICFTENAFEFFMKSALGIARCFHEKAEEQKSISVSRTFPTISSYSDMEKKIKELAELLADDLQYLQKLAKHLSVTAKTHKFEIKSKNLILDKYLKSQEEIFELSAKLLKQLWPIDPVRLLSIKLSDLIDEQTLKENSIEKYLIKPLKKKISEENAFHLDHEDDKNIAEEIDRILELENIQNKDSPNFKEEQSEKTENLIHEVQKESFKKESLAISKAKENKIPQYFKCFICNQEINCSGNSIRMNNHIDKCLLDQNKERQEIEGINLDVSTGQSIKPTAYYTSNKPSNDNNDNIKIDPPKTFFQKYFGLKSCIASPKFKNRWLMVIPCFMSNLSIGFPYAWSIVAGQLIRENGFVASSALDWSLAQATYPISIILFIMGISSALLSSLQIKYGIRATLFMSSLLFGGGMLVGSIGIATHQLMLIYFGYGFMSGCALGIAYTPPLQVLIEWFPDRKGLASGLAVAGFASGSVVFTPVFQYLSQKFQKLPEYAGSFDKIRTITQNGRLYLEQTNGALREVVLANAADLSRLQNSLIEGFYFVGTGDTGTASALAVYGFVSTAIMIGCSFIIKKPASNYIPFGYVPAAFDNKNSSRNVNVRDVMKTPQYWFLMSTIYFLGTGALGIFSVAKPMMLEVFGTSLPKVVDAAFAGMFVMLLTSGNLLGRLLWALLSDKIGRRATFFIFTFGSIPLYLSLPALVGGVVTYSSLTCLYAFIGCSVLLISINGGAFAILPAYEADLYGSKYIGPIHGRFLLAGSAASLTGPSTLLFLRKRSELIAIDKLLEKIDPEKFKEFFGVDISKANELIEAKTITINKLMNLVPDGVQNPTPFLYESTLYSMAGLMALAAASHCMVRPLNEKYFEKGNLENEQKIK